MKVEHAVEEGLSVVCANIFHHSKATMTAAFIASLRANGFDIVPVAERDAARAAVIEECARVAEQFNNVVICQSVSDKERDERKGFADGYWACADDAAAAIRALVKENVDE